MSLQRTYFRRALLPLLALGLGAAAAMPPLGRAAALFDSRPLDARRFAVLAKPVADHDWALLVLEQVAAQPRCWDVRSDGLVDPSLNRFDYTGICSRYLDSNGYSLRVNQRDLANQFRLHIEQQGNRLELRAMDSNQPTELLVGQGQLSRRDRDGFVLLELQPGWELQRRVFGQQTLNHLYFANPSPLEQLVAGSGGGPSRPSNGEGAVGARAALLPPTAPNPNGDGRLGPIALQVIPYQP